jgi:hypothetical protein
MIIDRAGGYMSTDSELRAKLLQENAKEKGWKVEISEPRIPEGIVTVDPKGTRVSGLSAPGKIKGRLKGRKVEIFEPRIPEGIVTVDSRRPRVVRSWTPGEMLREQAKFEN